MHLSDLSLICHRSVIDLSFWERDSPPFGVTLSVYRADVRMFLSRFVMFFGFFDIDFVYEIFEMISYHIF